MADDKSEPGWRKAWDETDEEDYVFTDGHDMIGRVYFHTTGGLVARKWQWFYGARSGITESRREAMLAVELAYEAGRAKG